MTPVAESTKKQGGDGSTLAAVLEKKSEQIPYEVIEEERLVGSRVRFKLKLTEDAIAGRLDETVRDFSKQVRLPGFRPGKAPKNLVRKSFEAPAREETIKRLIPRLTELYTEQKKYESLSQPYLLNWTSTPADGTTIELALEIHPDVNVNDDTLKDVSVTVHKIRIDEDYINKSLENLREQNATFEPTEEGYRPKDGMLINCTVLDAQGIRIEDRCAQQYYTTRIEEEMPEGVASALVGKKKGETLSLDVQEDSEFNPGQKDTVHYDVEIHEVKKRSLPNLDDEFAKDVNEQFGSLADLRKNVQEGAGKQEEARQREESINAVYDVLRERHNFDLPRALVESTANRSVKEMEGRLNQYGLSLRTMDQQIVRSYAASMQEQAKVNVKNYLIMRALAKFLGVTPTEEQVTEALENASKQTGRKPLAIRAQLEAKKQWGQFVEDLTLKLTNDVVLTKVAVSLKDINIDEFQKIQAERQQAQAAKLRGEAPASAQ